MLNELDVQGVALAAIQGLNQKLVPIWFRNPPPSNGSQARAISQLPPAVDE
jgi:hypothetical protein